MSMDFTIVELQAAALILVVDDAGAYKWSSTKTDEEIARVLQDIADEVRNRSTKETMYDFPEGSMAYCRYCHRRILLDQREGGGEGKDWGYGPDNWTGNGGTGMDYGCEYNPESDEEGTAGHVPDPNTVEILIMTATYEQDR